MRHGYTPAELRALSKQTGPQWAGTARAAMAYAADVMEAADAVIRERQRPQAAETAQQVMVPQGLLKVLREASEFIGAANYPLADTLDGFAWMLSAAPQPPQAALVPMTDEQIISEATEIDCDQAFIQGFERGARFAEVHHGIGVKK